MKAEGATIDAAELTDLFERVRVSAVPTEEQRLTLARQIAVLRAAVVAGFVADDLGLDLLIRDFVKSLRKTLGDVPDRPAVAIK